MAAVTLQLASVRTLWMKHGADALGHLGGLLGYLRAFEVQDRVPLGDVLRDLWADVDVILHDLIGPVGIIRQCAN